MKLQFKHQKFQADAAKAVVDVFAGQPYLRASALTSSKTGQHLYRLFPSHAREKTMHANPLQRAQRTNLGNTGMRKTGKSFSCADRRFHDGKLRRLRRKRSHPLARRPEKPVYSEKQTKKWSSLRRISSIRVT